MAASIATLWVVLSACGGGSIIKQADKSLSVALSATNAARDNFVAYDKNHQLTIVDNATTREEGEAAQKAYRGERDAVLRAFTAAYSAIAAAAAIIPLIEKGDKKERDLRALLADALKAAISVKDAVDLIQKGPD